ncbi:MAG: hypothetical protein LVT47_09460 [Cyanobacteria bacterium LVE1205-1]|jgi:hypothetical protein|nr:hypothetical protein [Cyanobacteria bacterium WB6_1B_304]
MTIPQSPSTVPPQVLIGLATVPFLGTLLVSNSIINLMGELGQLSEELFRGDRLPLLPLKANGEIGNPDSP